MNTHTMRVLLLADTHGVLDPRIAELAQDCTLAVHAGDVGASAVLEKAHCRRRAGARRAWQQRRAGQVAGRLG